MRKIFVVLALFLSSYIYATDIKVVKDNASMNDWCYEYKETCKNEKYVTPSFATHYREINKLAKKETENIEFKENTLYYIFYDFEFRDAKVLGIKLNDDICFFVY